MGTGRRVTVEECGECGELHESAARAQECVHEDLTGWPWGSGIRGVVGGGWVPGRCPSPGMDTTPDADVRLAGQQTKGAAQSTLSHGVSQAPALFACWLDFNADLGRRTALFWPPDGCGGQHACGTGPAWAILFCFPGVEQLCPHQG